jgi:hypothetical protein
MTPYISYMDMAPPGPSAEPGMFVFASGQANTMSWGGQPGGIYRWMGGNDFLHTFSSPYNHSVIRCMGIGDDGTVYASSNLTGTMQPQISRWNSATSSWVDLNGGINGIVSDMQFIDGKLYVCGTGLSTATQSPALTFSSGVAVWNPATELWEQLPWNTSAFTSVNAKTLRKIGSRFFLVGDVQTGAGGRQFAVLDSSSPNAYIASGTPGVIMGLDLQQLDDGTFILMGNTAINSWVGSSVFSVGTSYEDSGQIAFNFNPPHASSSNSAVANGYGIFSETGSVNDWVGVRTGRYTAEFDSSYVASASVYSYPATGLGWTQRRYSTGSRAWYVDMGAGKRIYHPTFNTVTGYPWTMISYDYNDLKTVTSYPPEQREVATDGSNGLRMSSTYFPDYNALDI